MVQLASLTGKHTPINHILLIFVMLSTMIQHIVVVYWYTAYTKEHKLIHEWAHDLAGCDDEGYWIWC